MGASTRPQQHILTEREQFVMKDHEGGPGSRVARSLPFQKTKETVISHTRKGVRILLYTQLESNPGRNITRLEKEHVYGTASEDRAVCRWIDQSRKI